MSNVSTKMEWLPTTEFQLAVSSELRDDAIDFCKEYFKIDEWHVKYNVMTDVDFFYFKTYDQIDHFMNGSDKWTAVLDDR